MIQRSAILFIMMRHDIHELSDIFPYMIQQPAIFVNAIMTNDLPHVKYDTTACHNLMLLYNELSYLKIITQWPAVPC